MLPRLLARPIAAGLLAAAALASIGSVAAQERLPWERPAPPAGMQRLGADDDPYRNEPPPPAPFGQPPANSGYGNGGYGGGGYSGGNAGGGYGQPRQGDA